MSGGIDEAWHWLGMLQLELLMFAGVFFLAGACDDMALDGLWLWLKLTGQAHTPRRDRALLRYRPLHAPAAVVIPAWQEAEVIGHTMRHILESWPQADLRLYIGCYRNDAATLAAAMGAASGEARVRIVIHDRDGPTTKADCLNRVYRAIRDDEQRCGRRFAMVVFHDAEDLVDPAALGLLDEAIAAGTEFAQLPVEPLVQHHEKWFANQLGSHYCDEFAEAHGKTMVVRAALGAGLPGAGVGCAVARGALERLAASRADGQPFSNESLTEDYELGLGIAARGDRCRFLRARGDDDRLIATRALFPAHFDQVVRQKSRWVHGIALQGWDRIGWEGGFAERWMRARDRRGPLTALVLFAGYVLIVLSGIASLAVLAGLTEAPPISPLLGALLWANLAALMWRSAMRFSFSARNYGLGEGFAAVLRLPLANVVAIIAGRRAVLAYARALSGKAVDWDKTEHSLHPSRIGLAEVPAE